MTLVLAQVGGGFPGDATSTRERVRPAIIDCCRSAAHEAALHNRLPHPCALLSGRPWPSRLPETRPRPARSTGVLAAPASYFRLLIASLEGGLLIAVQAELASLCASLELFLAANAYTDNCGFAPMLVGKMEASWMFRLAMW